MGYHILLILWMQEVYSMLSVKRSHDMIQSFIDSMTNTRIKRFINVISMITLSPSSESTLFVNTHYPMISLLSLFLLSLVLSNLDNGEFRVLISLHHYF